MEDCSCEPLSKNKMKKIIKGFKTRKFYGSLGFGLCKNGMKRNNLCDEPLNCEDLSQPQIKELNQDYCDSDEIFRPIDKDCDGTVLSTCEGCCGSKKCSDNNGNKSACNNNKWYSDNCYYSNGQCIQKAKCSNFDVEECAGDEALKQNQKCPKGKTSCTKQMCCQNKCKSKSINKCIAGTGWFSKNCYVDKVDDLCLERATCGDSTVNCGPDGILDRTKQCAKGKNSCNKQLCCKDKPYDRSVDDSNDSNKCSKGNNNRKKCIGVNSTQWRSKNCQWERDNRKCIPKENNSRRTRRPRK